MSTVFQLFSKDNGSAKENIGVGYVKDTDSPPSIMKATGLAKATHIIKLMPDRFDTRLDVSGFHHRNINNFNQLSSDRK